MIIQLNTVLLLLVVHSLAFQPLHRPVVTRTRTKVHARNDGEKQQICLEFSASNRSFRARSFWMAQEFLLTFQDTPQLEAITLVARDESDDQLQLRGGNKDRTLWRYAGGEDFAELKELKQIIRDEIDPEKDLGHSDANSSGSTIKIDSTQTVLNLDEEQVRVEARDMIPTFRYDQSNHLSITYCTGCRWLLRAAFLAQELMIEYPTIHSVSLVPARPPIKGGAFLVTLDSEIIWDRSETKRFPELDDLSRIIGDKVVPFDEIGDDEATDMRQYFGVL